MPRATFVANPENGESMHNRGTAVDITLVKLDGNSIDMGTSFVFFGKEAHIDNSNLSNEILINRNLLFEGMRLFGFQTLQTEWCILVLKKSFNTYNFPFPCEN